MSLDASAALVERGDPDRFLAVMAAPPAARARLFPLYAFNLEVARAPQVTREPAIAEIRLTWWREALEEIAAGGPVRQHEVVVPLALALPSDLAAELVPVLDDLIVARHLDIDRLPFSQGAALTDYLDRTAGHLLWAAARLLGAEARHEAAVRALGRAQGLANWLLATPALKAMGWEPLPESEVDFSRLAGEALTGLAAARAPRNPALLAAWRARAILRQAVKDPSAVLEGRLGQSEFQRKFSLLWRSFLG